MTIMVTGGAGFIGSNFIVEWLSSCQENVINFDKLTYAGNISNLSLISDHSSYRFIHGDICRMSDVDTVLNQYRPRAIIHFAAETHVDRSIHEASDFIQTNIIGTFNLLQSVRRYLDTFTNEEKNNFRFIHISTDEVYGSLNENDVPFTEGHRFSPNNPYAAPKASSDHLVRSYHQTYGIPVITTNCSNNYGPHQFPEKLIPLMIERAIAGLDLPIYGDGQNIRDWLYVTDHCEALRRVLEAGQIGEVYNIGGGNEMTNLAIVEKICVILDRERPRQDGLSYQTQIIFVEDRAGHDKRYAIDSSKILNQLGWSPPTDFEGGIYKTVLWYLNHFNRTNGQNT